jgi:hypothetical protein
VPRRGAGRRSGAPLLGRGDLIGRRALTLAFGLALAALSAEAVVRWVLPSRLVYRHPRFQLEAVDPRDSAREFEDPLVGPGLRVVPDDRLYGLKRNLRARFVCSEFDVSFTTDELGRRTPSPRGSDLRVLGIGDSFTMGFGVEAEETFLSVLGSRLAERGVRAEVLNAGVLGYTPWNSSRSLLREGLLSDPDVVILQLWVGDDLCGHVRPIRPALRAESSWKRSLKFAARHSQLVVFLRERVRAVPAARRWLMSHGFLERFGVDRLLAADFAERCAADLSALGSLLDEVQAACLGEGARLVVVLIPLREQVYEEDRRRALAYDGAEAASLDPEAPNRAVAEILHGRDVELVDPLEALRAARGEGRTYFAVRDVHLTPLGHRVVGEALARRLLASEPGPR